MRLASSHRKTPAATLADSQGKSPGSLEGQKRTGLELKQQARSHGTVERITIQPHDLLVDQRKEMGVAQQSATPLPLFPARLRRPHKHPDQRWPRS